MTLERFIDFVLAHAKKYEIPPVVLLFGKRDAPEEIHPQLQQLGAVLQNACPQLIFRSGNQNGADREFVSQVDPTRLQIVPPYSGHRNTNPPPGADICPLDRITVSKKAETYLQTIDRGLYQAWLSQAGQAFQKARYRMRNLAMIHGFTKQGLVYPKASFGLYWDNLGNPKSGGTGRTVVACQKAGISVLNQKLWANWL